MKTSIGIFINDETKEEHEIFEECQNVIEPSSSQIKVLPNKTYINKNEVKAKPIDDELTSFKISGSVFRKKCT